MNEKLLDLFETMRIFCIMHGMEFDDDSWKEVKLIREAIRQYEQHGLTPLGFLRKFSKEMEK